MKWEPIIGLEIHVQLQTKSKIFSGASTVFGAEPNTQASSIDLGLPGVLPVVNAEVYPKAVAFGLSIGAEISRVSVFDRKNYFYPDLPKGYQITQMDKPIVVGGSVQISLENGISKEIQITRAHLEEDAGKSVHDEFASSTGIDLNRAGVPLLEIVSEPDMRSAKEAVAYARYIHQLVTYLGVSDGNMSEGSLRCDANVSIRPIGATKMGTRTEIKNVNSFRFLENAINFEISRQKAVLESGGHITQETRLYDPTRDETRSMRSKETAMDYRYFPEPDLLPISIDDEYIADIRKKMPELPREKAERFVNNYQLTKADADTLAFDPIIADYFEATVNICQDGKLAANWVRVEILGRLNKDTLEEKIIPVPSTELGKLLNRIKDQTINGKIAKEILDTLWSSPTFNLDEYIKDHELEQLSNSNALEPLIEEVLKQNPKQAEQFRQGKTKLIGFFVGQVMKETSGKANPQQVNELVLKKLS